MIAIHIRVMEYDTEYFEAILVKILLMYMRIMPIKAKSLLLLLFITTNAKHQLLIPQQNHTFHTIGRPEYY